MREKPCSFEVRSYPVEVDKAAAAERRLTFTISTEGVDRYGDIIYLDGWQLKNFKLNPVVLWAHDRSMPPIARAVKVWKESESKALKSTAEFPEEGLHPMADLVFGLLREGFLHACSIGMNPLKWDWAKDEPRKSAYGIDFFESELLEWSVVPVPANAQALLAAEKSFDLALLRDWTARQAARGSKLPTPPIATKIATALGRRLLA